MSGGQVATTQSERNSPFALSRFFAIGPFPHSAVHRNTLYARIRSPRPLLRRSVQYMQTFSRGPCTDVPPDAAAIVLTEVPGAEVIVRAATRGPLLGSRLGSAPIRHPRCDGAHLVRIPQAPCTHRTGCRRMRRVRDCCGPLSPDANTRPPLRRPARRPPCRSRARSERVSGAVTATVRAAAVSHRFGCGDPHMKPAVATAATRHPIAAVPLAAVDVCGVSSAD